jgi:hypothetical protein
VGGAPGCRTAVPSGLTRTLVRFAVPSIAWPSPAAVAELREIAAGRGDLLAERAGVIFGFHDEQARDGRWPRRALEAALCIAAGADLALLTEWIAEGSAERNGSAETRGTKGRSHGRWPSPTPPAPAGDPFCNADTN